MKKIFSIRTSAIAALVATSSPIFAQTPPDAGRTLQNTKPPLQTPAASPGIAIEPSKSASVQPGGTQVKVSAVSFSGNTAFSGTELSSVVGEAIGDSLDLAGLKGLADKISDHYRVAGYPFARAFLPAQPITDGHVRIEVIEGKYGQVLARGDEDLVQNAQSYLSPLKSGDLIESAPLERAALLLDDLPGIKVTPVVRPGQAVGTGDLDVQVSRDQRFGGEVGLDNFGNRYSGAYRARLNLQADSPFMLGDQFALRSLYTDEGMWFGSLNYSVPLGSSGLRSNIGYAHTYYELSKEFSALHATGTADIASLGLTYPLLRSQRANINLSANLLHKELNDKQGATSTEGDKSSDSIPLAIGFDIRDALLGGGITFGSVSWTHGHLRLGNFLISTDATTARTQGDFDKFNLDLARLQTLPINLSLYGRFSGQWTDKNLDSSERFGLGGPYGVRAFPVGEGFGDSGWLAQIELRYTVGNFAPYAFYDAGSVTINAKPWMSAENRRNIAGTGVGVRFQKEAWSLDAALAWRTEGGKPLSDSQNQTPVAWVTAAFKF